MEEIATARAGDGSVMQGAAIKIEHDPTPGIWSSYDESPEAHYGRKEGSRNWTKDTHRSRSSESSDRPRASSPPATRFPRLPGTSVSASLPSTVGESAMVG